MNIQSKPHTAKGGGRKNIAMFFNEVIEFIVYIIHFFYYVATGKCLQCKLEEENV